MGNFCEIEYQLMSQLIIKNNNGIPLQLSTQNEK